MFNCRCEGTTGLWIDMTWGRRLFVCDYCKGTRMVQPVISRFAIDLNLSLMRTLYAERKRGRGGMVDARDLKSLSNRSVGSSPAVRTNKRRA